MNPIGRWIVAWLMTPVLVLLGALQSTAPPVAGPSAYPCTTTARAAAYTCDGPATAGADARKSGGSESCSIAPQWSEAPAAIPVRAGHAPTTPVERSVATEAESGASSAANGARLNEQLRLTEKYGAGGVKELPDGRMRFYGETTPAKSPGEMAGARLVREWDPATGAQRTWYETLDQEGNVRIVRPESGDPKVHYTFGPDGTYTGSR